MNVTTFFSKNLKYITYILLFLLFIKYVQGCNRNMYIRKIEKENTHLVDSMTSLRESEKAQLLMELQLAKDSIKELNYEVKLAQTRAKEAERRAAAVQRTAERVRRNTTIKIENKSDKDTVSVQK